MCNWTAFTETALLKKPLNLLLTKSIKQMAFFFFFFSWKPESQSEKAHEQHANLNLVAELRKKNVQTDINS